MSGIDDIYTTGKIVKNATTRLIECAEDRMNLQFRDHTPADEEAYDRKCRDAAQNAGTEASEGAHDIIRKRLTGNLLERGFNKHDATTMVEHQMEHMKSLYPKIKAKLTIANKMAMTAIGAMVAFAVGGSIYLAATKPPTISPPTISPAMIAIQQNADMEQRALETSNLLHLEEDQFNSMQVAMAAPMAVPPPDSIAAMPAAVAAIADEPVAVETTSPDEGTSVEVKTLGQVYISASRQVQHQIEVEAPHIDHDYDHPDPHSCVVTDCLDQHRDQWNRDHNSQEHHKEIDMTSGDGSSRIRVQY